MELDDDAAVAWNTYSEDFSVDDSCSLVCLMSASIYHFWKRRLEGRPLKECQRSFEANVSYALQEDYK